MVAAIPRFRSGAILVVLFSFGCQSPPPTYQTFLAPGHAGAPGVERVLLLPMNLRAHLPDFLLDASQASRDALVRRLERAERSVERLRLSAARDAWRLSVAAVGPLTDEGGELIPERMDLLYADLARSLSKDHRFDVMILPSLVVREAAASGRVGRWDGVSEEMKWIVDKKAPGVTPENLLMTGATRGLSLRLRIYTPAGIRVFEARQGLELVDQIRLNGRYYRAEVRGDLCTDPGLMDARLDDALDPYLPHPPEPETES